MMRFFSLLLLGLPLLAMAESVEKQGAARVPDESMMDMNDLDDETLATLRGSSYSEGDAHGRQLWGFSFTNLLCKLRYLCRDANFCILLTCPPFYSSTSCCSLLSNR